MLVHGSDTTVTDMTAEQILYLTQDEAKARSQILPVERYDIEVDMRDLLEGEVWRSVSTVRFTCSEPGASTFVDVVGEVHSAQLNGQELDLSTHAGGRLPLSGLTADNTLVVSMSQHNTGSAEGILRTVDPTDGLVYVWTSLEADDARRVWACFDQPDLKAPHRFVVTAPESWVVTSNGAPESITQAPDGDGRVWTYPDTPPLSTYVVVVNAGPFHEIRQQHDGYDLGFFCRQSLIPHLERDLDEMVTVTRQSLAFFADKFGIAFPQERYDQVFVPNLGGAMENWGCVTYGDAQLFRTPGSYMQRETRAEFILHEMAHMWFGDLVTMQWWDDLWLNEAFASWASCWALGRVTQFDDIWATFLAGFKKQAYEMDMSPARHPIRGEVPDVSVALANFDAITYLKGQSVLHQLMAYIGEDAFVAGLQAYFAKHAWSNTRLSDLMDEYAAAAGQDLTEWTSAWLDRAGPDVISLDAISLDGATVSAQSPDEAGPRPHRFDIAHYAVGDTLSATGVTEVSLVGSSQDVGVLDGELHLLNSSDVTYAVVRPDARSQEIMFDRVAELPDPLSRAVVINTATQLLLLGELAPRIAAKAATKALASEPVAGLAESFASQGYLFADRWAPGAESAELKAALAEACVRQVDRPDASQAALRMVAQCATSDADWAILEEAAAKATDTDLTWRMLARRAELGDLDRAAADALLTADPDPDAHIRHLMVLAQAPDTESKDEVWKAFFVDRSVPASRETLVLGQMFWRSAQHELLEPYTYRYLDELTRMAGGLLNQGVVIRAMYPQGVGDAAFADAAEHATSGDAISAYAKNQVRAQTFVLRQILTARTR